MEATIVYWGYIGIMDKKWKLLFRPGLNTHLWFWVRRGESFGIPFLLEDHERSEGVQGLGFRA